MRISDWSSDVCSSDLKRAFAVATTFHAAEREFPGSRVVRTGLPVRATIRQVALQAKARDAGPPRVLAVGGSQGAGAIHTAVADRSEERRVGQEGVRTWRFRWSPAHKKKKKKEH